MHYRGHVPSTFLCSATSSRWSNVVPHDSYIAWTWTRLRLSLYERIYQRKRYCTEFLSEHERARNVRDLHRGDLEPWPRGAPEETGTKMAAVAEERTSRSLVGDCVMAA